MKLGPTHTCFSFAASVALALGLASGSYAQTSRRPNHPRKAAPPTAPTALPCGDVLGFQVKLDKAGFSSGEIDGTAGPNFTHALAAFQQAKNLKSSSAPDCDTWNALGGGDTATVAYTITEADVKGPFVESIPADLVKQAALPSLGYRTPLERLAESFHSAPALLQRLNRGSRFAAGDTIQVPDVQRFDADAKPVADPAAGDVTIEVSRDGSALTAKRGDGTLVFFAPVTTGSEHDPLPIGDWKVTAVGWHPPFHYNPDLFWDAKATDTKATIKPGPNNPVGVVWIDLSKEHYGIHGTPEPGQIGHVESHGCVRLTNWDAARVAALVKPGTPVLFR